MEIGIVSYSSGPDMFQFIALSNIPANQVIFFTDNGVNLDGSFRDGEGVLAWRAPVNGVSLGTIVTVDATLKIVSTGSLDSASSNFNFAASGDQLIAYTNSATSPTFLLAFNNDGQGFAADATSSQTTALPPGLETGVNAVSVVESSFTVYNGLTIGSLDDIRKSLFEPESFLTVESATSFTGTFSIDTSITKVPSPFPTISPTKPPTPTTAPTPRPTPLPGSNEEYLSSLCVGYPVAPLLSPSADTIPNANKAALTSSTKTVILQGIVTNDLRLFAAKGFYIQSPTSHEGAAPSEGGNSQGIFIFCSSSCAGSSFKEGDYVQVSGSLGLFSKNPQVNSPTVTLLTSAPVDLGFENCPQLTYQINVVDISLPMKNKVVFQTFQGMLVHFQQTLTVTDSYVLQYGEIGLSANGRLINPTMQVAPGTEEYFNLTDLNSRNYIVLDDVLGGTCPATQLYFDPSFGLRTGWTLSSRALDATTTMTYFSTTEQYFLIPNTVGRALLPTAFNTIANPRISSLETVLPSTDTSVGGLRIAGMNMLNYFTTFGCSSCRGADNADEFLYQSRKLYAVIAGLDAAVIGLQEVQNDGGDIVLTQLITELNQFLGSKQYDFISTGEVGNDAVRNAIIYKPSVVTPVGAYQKLVYTNPSDKSRDSLAQTFKLASGCNSSSKFTVVINHLKSKGSECSEDVSGIDTVEGESNCGFTRLKHAQQLVAWLQTDPTKSNSTDVLLIGDFNSYKLERAVLAITDAKYVNLAERDVDPKSLYSLSFDGTFGTLDYMFSSPSMSTKCSNTLEWHINCDEPVIIDYNEEQYSSPSSCTSKPDGYRDFSVFRSSDHDPIVSYCQLECATVIEDPTVTTSEASKGLNGVAAMFIVAAFVLFVVLTTCVPSRNKKESVSVTKKPEHSV